MQATRRIVGQESGSQMPIHFYALGQMRAKKFKKSARSFAGCSPKAGRHKNARASGETKPQFVNTASEMLSVRCSSRTETGVNMCFSLACKAALRSGRRRRTLPTVYAFRKGAERAACPRCHAACCKGMGNSPERREKRGRVTTGIGCQFA